MLEPVPSTSVTAPVVWLDAFKSGTIDAEPGPVDAIGPPRARDPIGLAHGTEARSDREDDDGETASQEGNGIQRRRRGGRSGHPARHQGREGAKRTGGEAVQGQGGRGQAPPKAHGGPGRKGPQDCRQATSPGGSRSRRRRQIDRSDRETSSGNRRRCHGVGGRDSRGRGPRGWVCSGPSGSRGLAGQAPARPGPCLDDTKARDSQARRNQARRSKDHGCEGRRSEEHDGQGDDDDSTNVDDGAEADHPPQARDHRCSQAPSAPREARRRVCRRHCVRSIGVPASSGG